MNRLVKRSLEKVTFVAAFAALLPFALGQDAKTEMKPLKIGADAPGRTVALKNVDGKPVTFDGVKGAKGTLVVFSCNHCPYVKAWEDRLVEIGNAGKAQGVGVLVVNSNDPTAYADDAFEKMQEQAKAKKYAFAYAMDEESELARAFGATKTPEAFLFDAKGKLVYHGAIDDNSEKAGEVKSHYLKDAIDALVAGKPIATPETKSIGCGIKLRPSKSEKKAG